MVFLGSQAVASPVWGLITQYAGLRTAVLTAAALVGSAPSGGWSGGSRTTSTWTAPRRPTGVRRRSPSSPTRGPAQWWCRSSTTSPTTRRTPSSPRWSSCALSRLRSGASRWELYRVGESPEVFVEQFQVPTWREHLRQHEGRLTAEDQAIENAAFGHVLGSPFVPALPPATHSACFLRAAPN